MNKFILTSTTLLLLNITQAQTTAKNIDTRISDVTIFMSGAQVTESGSVQLKEGENQLRLNDLTLYLDPNSIQVEGNSNYTIMSVRHQVNYLLDQTTNPRVKALQDSMSQAQLRNHELVALKTTVQEERELLHSNRDIKGNNSVLLAEDLKEMADFYRARFKEIEYKWLELTEQEKDNNEEINRLQYALNQLNTRKGQNPSEILVTVRAEKASTTTLKLSYVVQNAGWYPVYDLRADDINSPIEFMYRAKVYQSTGNDWEDVNLTISTGNPNVGGQAPILYPWYVNLYEPMQYDYKRKANYDDAPAVYNETPSVSYDWEGDKAKGEWATSASFTTTTNNTVSTEFKISIPYDIPSDNQQYDVIMQEETLKASYAYVTIPKLDNDAFLRAQIVDWAQYSLLPGESNIYFKGTFVGKGYIDPALANDTLNISMGRDRAINIKRDQIKEFCKTDFFGGKQKTTKAFEITVQNNKKQAIDVVIEDQIPISQNGDIEVETEELSGATHDATTGKVEWKVTIQPGEIAKKQLRFNVKYPKKKYVTGL
ncbi:MAG: DUF4139 domain-containing protein [Flavobacteriales bacterium]